MALAENLEIEIKLHLESFPDYLKLLGFLGSLDLEQRHINAFFDTQDRDIENAGWALRIRAEDYRGLVTVKGPGTRRGAAVVREEREAEIDRGAAVDIIDGRADPMKLEVGPILFLRKRLGHQAVRAIAQFRNERKCKRFRIGDFEYVLEIDKTEFADSSVDYELEVEVPGPEHLEVVEAHLRKVFESLQIRFQVQDKSKFRRALERQRRTV